MLSVHGPYDGDRTESRSYFYDQQCVGTSFSRDGKHYYRPTRSNERPVFDTPQVEFFSRRGFGGEALTDTPPIGQRECRNPRTRVFALIHRAAAIGGFGSLRGFFLRSSHTPSTTDSTGSTVARIGVWGRAG